MKPGAVAILLPAALLAGLVAFWWPADRGAARNAALTAQAVQASAAGMPGAIVVRDYLGREVVLRKPAQRIVALSPHIVENLFSAGLGDRIVATVDNADYPPRAGNIPRIGGFSNFSREAIVQFRPDLVIGWAAGYDRFGKLLAQLETLGVAVYADDPRSFADIARSIADFARLGAVPVPGELLQDRLHKPLARLRAQRAQAAGEPVRVFYQIWHEPLQSLNGNHIVNAAIETCGGRNIFADAPVLAPRVSLEAVLSENPEVIIASSASAARPSYLDNWLRWPDLAAVRNNQLYHLHGDLMSRHTLRMVPGVQVLCQQIAAAATARSGSQARVPRAAMGETELAINSAGRAAVFPGSSAK